MLNRIIVVVIFVPVAILLVALAVANRQMTSFTFDPFNPGNAALSVQMPLFVMLFLALILGMVIGGVAAWLKQGRYRKEARTRRREVQSLLQQKQPAPVASASAPPPGVPALRG
ncbi:LapA family protein [Aquibium carbonis]|uniref:LapA family protein n=1 Tax=Aquibium carbonis TaxID=2495581 RepID=A0A429YG50_9HYPH|nr:LapA family protein [Aquibium carbonis]RST80376.1 LapA family protein [Aquibium carbonis]